MKKILSKILDEINKETPRLDYIRGLIEASIEEDIIKIAGVVPPLEIKDIYPPRDNQNIDEEIIPEAAKIGPIAPLS